MSVVRWFALVLIAFSFAAGCQQKPDTDIPADQLEVPKIEEGDEG